MRRKLIAQGKGGITLSMPIKYIRDIRLKPGDEMDVDEEQGRLIIEPADFSKKSKKEISLNLRDVVESALRTILVNSYRAGYDKIKVKAVNKQQINEINRIVTDYLLGFEVLDITENSCTLEEVAQPSDTDFKNIYIKIFHMISLLFEHTVNSEDIKIIEELMSKIQRYDNFCRRAISKKIITEEKSMFYWSFFGIVIHAARKVFFYNRDKLKYSIKPSKDVLNMLKKTNELFEMLKSAYLKKDIELLDTIQEKEKSLIYKEGFSKIIKQGNNNILIYHLMDSIRNIYLASSPLYGIIIKES